MYNGKGSFYYGLYGKLQKNWCEDTYFDEATRAELKAIEGNDKEIHGKILQRFGIWYWWFKRYYRCCTNRLNIYTVSKATQGFANYIIKQGEEAVKKVLLLPLTVEE